MLIRNYIGSTGNVCTVRCRNNAVAGPFGGCFPVQQTDVDPTANTPQNIKTAQGIDATLAQVLSNQKDLPAAVQANANAGADGAKQNLAAVEAILGISVTTSVFPQQTLALPDVSTDSSAPSATSETGNGNTNNRGQGRTGTGGNRGGNNNNGNNNNNNSNGNNRNSNNNRNNNNGNANKRSNLRWAWRMN